MITALLTPLVGLVPMAPEINPTWVRPGYTPLIILILLAGVMTLLYFSLRRQMKRINVPYASDLAEQTDKAEPAKDAPKPE